MRKHKNMAGREKDTTISSFRRAQIGLNKCLPVKLASGIESEYTTSNESLMVMQLFTIAYQICRRSL